MWIRPSRTPAEGGVGATQQCARYAVLVVYVGCDTYLACCAIGSGHRHNAHRQIHSQTE